jgi:bacterioferritin-associated ferredoxin
MKSTRCSHGSSGSRAMTKCECLEVSFDLLAARMERTGESVDEMMNATGCGSLCTACVPDLKAHLARAVASKDRAA